MDCNRWLCLKKVPDRPIYSQNLLPVVCFKPFIPSQRVGEHSWSKAKWLRHASISGLVDRQSRDLVWPLVSAVVNVTFGLSRGECDLSLFRLNSLWRDSWNRSDIDTASTSTTIRRHKELRRHSTFPFWVLRRRVSAWMSVFWLKLLCVFILVLEILILCQEVC